MQEAQYKEEVLRLLSPEDDRANTPYDIDNMATFMAYARYLDTVKRNCFYAIKPDAAREEKNFREVGEITELVAENILDQCAMSLRSKLTDHVNDPDILHAVLGICTEAGELLEWYMKYAMTGEANWDNLVEEMGDHEWYSALLRISAAKAMNKDSLDIETIWDANIAKLNARAKHGGQGNGAFGGERDIKNEIKEMQKAMNK